MWMDAGMDTGDILLQESMPIEPSDDAGSLLARLAKAGAPLLVRTLRLLSVGRCPRVQQPDQGVSLAPPILPEDCLLRFSETAESLQNRVRAMSPRPGAFAELGGRRIKVWSAEALAGSAAPGEIVKVDRSGIDAGAADGLLRLLEVQAEGSRRMPAQAWANGARVKPGDRFRVVALTPDVAGGVN
jgi:methionyl-tRNA formyltransferase